MIIMENDNVIIYSTSSHLKEPKIFGMRFKVIIQIILYRTAQKFETE